ncbi:NlpC/P60 family protein [Sphaerisporangium sp. TRM90804]|uniref:NlpC/P60 family protein n=1 Tax=Sphaerisporangium sp. TRM90804 TaxID=3031113 RepID=UPI002448FD09|nr:NlpC/P60 family protein [Sphaerisporangium sp. TRM90804]MDH2428819.1 NlpC/P60 family protein [Sphaerisporangium sp. TRM90804]
MLDRRPRGSTVVRERLTRGLGSARAYVGGALAEAREDLSYGPRLRPRPRALSPVVRRLVPSVAVGLVAVLAADLMLLGEMNARSDEIAAAARQEVPKRVTGYVAATRELPVAAAPPPAVAPLSELRKPHLFVVAPRSLSSAAVARVRGHRQVGAVEVVDAAEVAMAGKRVQTMGVDPSTFRAYTPRSTAKSDALWNGVAAGDVAVSFTLGSDGGVALGSTVDAGGRKLRVGAYATMGMGLINAVVSHDMARSLGVPAGNALVVSAPGADSGKLRLALLKLLPKGSQIALINPVLKPPASQGRTATAWPQGSFMTTDQLRVALTAAAGKLGRPYVWGAEGPETFDCSGLVQWAFRQAGVLMPRVTHQQWVAGPQVPLAQAQPGDLLFWRNDPTNPGYISHVAIYWGNGKMLHAPRTGDVVKIAPVSTRNLAGVVRVSPQVSARVR